MQCVSNLNYKRVYPGTVNNMTIKTSKTTNNSHNGSAYKSDMQDAIQLMGFDTIDYNFYRRVDDLSTHNQLIMYAILSDHMVEVSMYKDAIEVDYKQFTEPTEFIDYIEHTLQSNDIVYMEAVQFSEIMCASNSRDMAKRLQRVKSSNVWSYAFSPKDNKVGDMLMQFKNKDGGAGDIYIYYDVPNKVWRQLVGAPSKGHAFWKLIRNVYTYAKLTGDKRTHLPNGI